MPLLISGTTSTTSSTGRRYLIPGMPVFNTGDDFIISDVDGWEDPAAPDAVYVPNGGGAGSVASGPWVAKEKLLTVSGSITVPADQQAMFRRLMLAGLPTGAEVPFVGYGNGDDDLQMFVRRYDSASFQRFPNYMDFSVPLIALDPFKYALQPLTGTVGVWTGEDWYASMTEAPAGVWSMPMVLSGGRWGVQLIQDVPTGPYPVSLTVTSDGDVASQRVTATITGPLTAGDWYLWSDNTESRMWVEVGVNADQTLILDSRAKTATLSGTDVTHLTYGDWLSLEPGTNTFRLVAGTDSDAFCVLSALPAYE